MYTRVLTILIVWMSLPLTADAQQIQPEDGIKPFNKPEQCRIRVRSPDQLRQLPSPLSTAPPTVSVPHPAATELRVTLDETIRMALQNSEVIRILAGNTAVSSGSTIYDVAQTHTGIDAAIATFDPVFSANNTFSRSSRAVADPMVGGFDGSIANAYSLDIDVTQQNLSGGTARLGINNDWSRTSPRGLLNSRNEPSVEVAYTQPLLAGAGVEANRAPILIARITTERSYFRFKDSYQNLVQSVIDGYWNLVFARTDLWARERQVEQAKGAYDQAAAEKKAGLVSGGIVAQRKVALMNFRANLVAARAALLDREAALKNVLGMPPNDGIRLIPTTPPTREEIRFPWEQITAQAIRSRPDLIELKLILDADQQQLLQSKNLARPNLDAVALYRWNGLSGQLPTGQRIRSGLHESGDWTMGVNFSVPVRLRASRANLRSTELLIARDRANLRQGQHAAIHELAQTFRTMASTYKQYEAFTETRKAASEFLKQQAATKQSGLANFLVVLQAITDWGNAVSSEARTLTLYNSQLALLELQTGTILETHGVRFCEEQYGSLGPLGRKGQDRAYPLNLKAQQNVPRYEAGDEPAEEFFDLKSYPNADISGRKPPVDDDDDDFEMNLDDLGDGPTSGGDGSTPELDLNEPPPTRGRLPIPEPPQTKSGKIDSAWFPANRRLKSRTIRR